jgi:hypothetical protein
MNSRSFKVWVAMLGVLLTIGALIVWLIVHAPFRAATAVIDITPSNNGFPQMWLAGYAYRGNAPADSTPTGQPTITARALAITKAFPRSAPRVIVTADVLGFTYALHHTIIQEAQTRYGLEARNILLSASHTHSGPVLADNLDPAVTYLLTPEQIPTVEAYTNWLKEQILTLIGTAIDRLKTAPNVTLWYGVSSADFAGNRLNTDPPVTDRDLDVPVLACQSESDKSWVAIVFGYACHPTTYEPEFDYHPDFPGIARQQLETQFGGTAFFIQGTAGDIRSTNDTNTSGTKLASAVSAVLNGNRSQVFGSIDTELREVDLPLNIDPQDTNHQALRGLYATLLGSDPVCLTPNGTVHANQIIYQIDAGKLPVVEP